MMKVFVWQWLNHVSDNYHEGGGCTVVAEDLARAKVIATEAGVEFDEQSNEPDVYELKDSVEEKVFIFPDAGCC